MEKKKKIREREITFLCGKKNMYKMGESDKFIVRG